eukprot:g8518.t1
MMQIKQCHTRLSVKPYSTYLPFGILSQHYKKFHFAFPSRLVKAKPRKGFMCSAEADSPQEKPSITGTDYTLSRGIYQFGTLVFTSTALGLLFAAPLLAEKYFGFCIVPVSELLLRAMGSVTIPVAAVVYCMQSAVSANRLDSPTYKRLSFVVALALTLVTGAMLWSMSKGVAFSNVSVLLSTTAHLLPAVAFYRLYGARTLGEIIPGFLSGIGSVFQPDTISSGIYSIFSVATLGYGLLAFCAPKRLSSLLFTFPTDVFSEFAIRSFGALLMLLSIVLYTLKDAADRNRLGFTTFKTLNFAVAFASIAKFSSAWYVCEMASRVAEAAGAETVCMMTTAGGASSMGLFLFLGLYCGYHAITEKKN